MPKGPQGQMTVAELLEARQKVLSQLERLSERRYSRPSGLGVDPATSVRADCYDLAMNGLELGSGSIRIHRKDVQQQIFASLGISDEEARSRFGFFLDALEFGTPPHGGIALGLDRIVMLLAGAPSLREVITFPKTAKAIDLMADAPTTVSEQQLKELHIKVAGKS